MFHRSRIPTKLRLKPASEPGLSILLVPMGPFERGASLESSVPLRGKLDCFVQMLGRWSRLETEYWLELLVDSGCVVPANMTELLDETRQLIAIFTTIDKNSRRDL